MSTNFDFFQGCAEGASGEVVPGTNCKQFKACANGMVSSCPGSDIFVPSVGMCRPAQQFPCEDKGNNSERSDLCGEGQAYGPYVESCAAFVVCDTNHVKKCMNGYLFDIVDAICRPAADATCYAGSGDDIPQYVKLECASLPSGSFVSHRNCEKYYVCDGADIQVANCPAGRHFSRAYNGCVPILKAGCKALGTVCVGQSVGFTFPSLDCLQYYSCPINGVPVLNTCSSGTVYNPSISSCVPSAAYDCKEELVIPGHVTNNPPTEPTVTTPSSTTPSSGGPNEHCSTVSSGTKVADPNDCTKYFMCNNGSAIPLVCYQGQYFSAENQLCSTNNPSC